MKLNPKLLHKWVRTEYINDPVMKVTGIEVSNDLTNCYRCEWEHEGELFSDLFEGRQLILMDSGKRYRKEKLPVRRGLSMPAKQKQPFVDCLQNPIKDYSKEELAVIFANLQTS